MPILPNTTRPSLFLCLLGLVLFASGCAMHGISPPPAPETYKWIIIPDMKAAFLKPPGWHHLQKDTADGKAVFISKENLAKQDFFVTGLSINMIPGFAGDSGTPATLYAQQLIYSMAGSRDLLSMPRTTHQEKFIAYDLMFHERNWAGEEVARYYLALANKQTDTLYIIIFEAPLASWGDAWDTISPVLENLYLDDEI